jgi:hypothetical protein
MENKANKAATMKANNVFSTGQSSGWREKSFRMDGDIINSSQITTVAAARKASFFALSLKGALNTVGIVAKGSESIADVGLANWKETAPAEMQMQTLYTHTTRWPAKTVSESAKLDRV